MALRYYKTGGKRFYVIDVTGWRINPQVWSAESLSQKPQTTWAVLDRDDMHREVAVFEPGGGYSSGDCESSARELADQLNAETVAA